MFRDLFGAGDYEARGAWMRRLHSSWLTRAMRRGSRVPRIPTRRVSEGGFDAVLSTPEGREWAEEFWSAALGECDEE